MFMKRTKKIFCAIGIFAVVIFAFFACDNGDDNEETDPCANGHIGLSGASAATCTTTGNSSLHGICSRCNTIVAGTVVPALGHDHTSSLICKRASCNHQYSIGETGPGGGKIFYVADGQEDRPLSFKMEGNDTNCYYLEAAPADIAGPVSQGGYIAWAPNTSPIFMEELLRADNRFFGWGQYNTTEILKYVDELGGVRESDAPAAYACDNYTNGGKSDWFLPSREELNELCKQRKIFDNWNTAVGLYWCSTPYWFGYQLAWCQVFSDADPAYPEGAERCIPAYQAGISVRAIRAF